MCLYTKLNEQFSENSMFFFVVINMKVSRCCLPSSVQCRTGDNPQGFSLCVCVCRAVSCPSSHVYFFYVVCFWVALSRAFHPWTTRQSGALWGLERERKKERDMGTPRKSKKRDTVKRGKSFKRLLTSKLTVIAVLARGESTFKHTGWVTMWRDYKSKVIHNKQHSLCSALPANLHESSVEEVLERSAKASCSPLTLRTCCNKIVRVKIWPEK